MYLAVHNLTETHRRPLPGWLCAWVIVLLSGSIPARAQSLGDLAAWDALVIAPIGATPWTGTPTRDHISAALHYGQWQYDSDDAVHLDGAVSLSVPVWNRRATLTGTIGVVALDCAGCGVWNSAGIDATALIGSRVLGASSSTDVSLRVSAGGGRFRGAGHARAGAFAVTLPAGVTLARGFVRAVVQGGIGIGRLWSSDNNAYGTRPIIGASVIAAARHVSLEASVQRIVISRGPSQMGLTLSFPGR